MEQSAVVEGVALALGGEPTAQEEYVVGAGETLMGIALRHRMRPQDLRRMNRLTNDSVHTGQVRGPGVGW